MTITGLTLSGADAGKYVLAPVTTTADITAGNADCRWNYGFREGVRRHDGCIARFQRCHTGGRGTW